MSTFSTSSKIKRPPLIVVMGVSGTGKSSLATALAEHYEYQFLDGDDFHSTAAKARMNQGLPLTDDMRSPWVSAICARLNVLSAQHTPCVLAFSGLRKLHRDHIRQTGFTVKFLFLNADQEIIQKRLQMRTHHFMSPQLLDSQFESLEDPLTETDVLALNIQESLPTVTRAAITALDDWLAVNNV